MLSEIVPIHTAVRGRARLHVEELKRSEKLKRFLEAEARGRGQILSLSANTSTGNLLVFYDPKSSLDGIIGRLESLVLQAISADVEIARPRQGNWHLTDRLRALKRLGSSPSGLTLEMHAARLARFGQNLLPQIEPRSRLAILLEQFQSLPVALLGVAAILSIATGGLADAVVIVSVIGLNAGIGYVTENHAERTIRSLSGGETAEVPVLRDGNEMDCAVEHIVPGDVLVLRPGITIAADARVIEAQGLALNEAMLTGESVPTVKTPAPLQGRAIPLADRVNMVYRGTLVTGGSGLAVVVGTGARTEIGRIGTIAGSARSPETPLKRQLSHLGRQLVWLSAGVCALVFLIGIVRGYGVVQMLTMTISLAVAAIPEGLPTLATTTLALGIERMRRHRILVRRLDALETLASVQAICLDKTGTLTFNRMNVTDALCADQSYSVADKVIFDQADRPVRLDRAALLRKLAELAVLCNETVITQTAHGSELTGSATENALVQFALDAGMDVAQVRRDHPLQSIQYRDEARLFMSSFHRFDEDRALVAVKGSPTEVLAMCRFVESDAHRLGRRPMTEDDRRAIESNNARLADEARRVLGFAYAVVDRGEAAETAMLRELTWVGLAGLSDPLRPGIADLLGSFRNAGITPVMITGDQPNTAAAVARNLHFGNGEPIIVALGPDLSEHSIADMGRIPHVFARVTPTQKLRIVQALQAAGIVAAMTGDGVNDSPALMAADVGIAMGRSGTEAAREAADVVLENDDLTALTLAIEQGRTTSNNIRKSIRYVLATNMSEILVTLVATAAGLGQPLTPLQLLWINLISDVLPGLALGLEPAEPGNMKMGPQDARAAIIGRDQFLSIGREATFISLGALGAYGYGIARHGVSAPARTIGFASLITAQLLHALTSRSQERGLFTRERLRANPILFAVLAGSFVAQSAAMFVPGIRRVLGISRLGLADGIVALAAGTLPFLANELVKIGAQDRRQNPHARAEPPSASVAGGA